MLKAIFCNLLVEAFCVDSMWHFPDGHIARDLAIALLERLQKKLFIALFLAKVQEMSFFSAFQDVFAEGAMLEDSLLEEVKFASLETLSSVLLLNLILECRVYGCIVVCIVVGLHKLLEIAQF